MDRSNRHTQEGPKHGWWHILVGCGIMLVAVLALPSLGIGWGSAIVLVALLACPLIVFVLTRDVDSDR